MDEEAFLKETEEHMKKSEEYMIHEFAASGVKTPDEIKQIFSEQFFFGCEADDPLNALAFATDLNPLGVGDGHHPLKHIGGGLRLIG